MRYLLPCLETPTRFDTYESARHDTLNFEACGGEPASPDDIELRPLGQLLHFPTKVVKRVVIHIQRKEKTMAEDNQESRTSHGASSARAGSGFQRSESFTSSGPIHATMATRSGDVRIQTSEGDNLEVTLRAGSAKDHELLDAAEIYFDVERNQLDIRTQPRDYLDTFRGSGGKKRRSWFDFGGSDVDISVVLPRASSIEIKTISGDVSLKGSLGDVSVSSISGDVEVPDSSDSLDVRTASGDVNTGHVANKLKCRSASGDVKCSGAAKKTEITSASGDVVLSADQPGDIVVKAVSGDVRVRVARGLAVDISGNTVSGDMGSNIDLDSAGDATSDEELIYIKVSTVSGDIRIDKAS